MPAKRAFRSIVIADDGSEEGERAAEVAVTLAGSLHAEVVLVGVVEPPNIQAEGSGLPLDNPGFVRSTMEARFERLMQLGQDLGVRISLQIRQGDPSDQINSVATKEHADLIVVGRRLISRFNRWISGSTSEDLMENAPCSVLVVR